MTNTTLQDTSKLNGNKIRIKEVDDEFKVDIRGLFVKYMHYLPLFLVTFGLAAAGAYLYLRYTKPNYSSSIKILIKDDDKKNGTTDVSKQILSGIISGSKENVANEQELVASYTLMEKVVRRLDINTVYSSIGNVTENEQYKTGVGKFIQFIGVVDSSQRYQAVIKVTDNKIFFVPQQIKDSKKLIQIPNNGVYSTGQYTFSVHITDFSAFNPAYTYKAVWVSPLVMAQRISSSLKVISLNKDASILKLNLESNTPAKSRDILNALSLEYNKSSIDEKNEMADNTIRFIDERLILIAGELHGVETNLKNFRETNNVIAIPDQGKFQLDRMKNIQERMEEMSVQMEVADMVKNYVNNDSRKYSLAPSSLGITDPALLGMVQQYNQQVLTRETLLKTLPPGNIQVKAIEGLIQQLQANIVETASNLKKSYQTIYNNTKTENSAIYNDMNTVPNKEKQLLEISRQQGIKEKLYIYLLEKREESAITRASAISNSVPIDPAVTTTTPIWPDKMAIFGFALAFGLGIPLLYIHLRDLLSNKVVTRADIKKYTHVPIIGEISHNDNKQSLIAGKTRGIIAEQFRILRANLQYLVPGAKRYNILVTSTMPGEGKTFASLNMGAVLASTGKKTVLLEFDMRKPKIAKILDLKNSKTGLSTYLTGNATLSDIVVAIPGMDNYYFIPTGPVPPNPAELLLSPFLDQLFAELNEQFEHIVIDSPPTAIVSDAKLLTNHCNVNLYIVRQRYTVKKHMEFVNELYEGQILKNMAIVVNDMVLKGMNAYYGSQGSAYGYGKYNYDYSYGYGYGVEKEKKGLRKWFSKGMA